MSLEEALIKGEPIGFFTRKRKRNDEKTIWDDAQTFEDLLKADHQYVSGKIDRTLWYVGALAQDHEGSSDKLKKLIEYGFLTIDGQSGFCGYTQGHYDYINDRPFEGIVYEKQRSYITGFLPNIIPLEMYQEIAKQGVSITIMTLNYEPGFDFKKLYKPKKFSKLTPNIWILNAPVKMIGSSEDPRILLTCTYPNYPNTKPEICQTTNSLVLMGITGYSELGGIKSNNALREWMAKNTVRVEFIRNDFCKQDLEDIVLNALQKYSKRYI